MHSSYSKSLSRLLARTIPIPIAKYARYKPHTIWGMAILTAMCQTSLEQTRRLQRQLRRALARRGGEADPAFPCSPDTVLHHLHKLTIGELTRRFNRVLTEQVKEAKRRGLIPKTKTGRGVVVALDTSDVPYYGRKKNKWILGCKRKAGTNWAYRMATAEIVEKGRRLCLGAQPVNQLVKTKKIVSKLVRMAKKHVKIRLLLLDREFFSIEVIQVLNRHRIPWLMPAVMNKEIRRKTQAIYQEKRTAVVGHILGDERRRSSRKHVKINLIILPPPEEPEKHSVDKSGKSSGDPGPLVFATNLDVGEGMEQWPRPLLPLAPEEVEALWVQRLAETYRKRWGIETGYRVKKEFRAKTSSVSPGVRFVFLFLSVILYNTWVLVNGRNTTEGQNEHHDQYHDPKGTDTGSAWNPRNLTTTTLRWLYIVVFSHLLPLDRWI